MSADSPRRQSRGLPATIPPQIVSDRSIIDSVAGFINDVTLTNQPQVDPKDTITWARFETAADISDVKYGDDWELEGNVAPPLLLILGYGLGVQVWAIPANGEAVEVLSWRHGHVTTLRILPTPISSDVEMADEPIDQFADKRPLMAICEGSPPGSSSQFSSVNFISLKEGTQVKTIKFKNTVLDILVNRTSIIITFPERIAVFDARTFEDRLSVTSCYPSPGINPNPVALGSRWMAYSENRLIHSKRSGGGCDGDGVSSYTATVLNAAKSLGKGLRELGEQVAAGLTGTSSSGSFSKPGSFDSVTGDIKQPGVITILDIKYSIKDISPTTGSPISVAGTDPFIAHFVAHLEAIVALEFDNSGMLLLTADKRGHNFHIFRIQPHPAGSQLASVHHLYVLHRGDTTAKVQNIAFSIDSRWVAVSTLRGTTHVFPINSYGGPAGVRTHASLHVVNRLSRFHRSAGLSADGRSSSPISHSDSITFNQVSMPYNNPTIPPFPRPHIVLPLAQLRQPSVLGSPPGSAQNSYTKTTHGRQRLSSLSDDNGKPLSVCAIFSKARSWLLDPPNLARETPAHKMQRKAVDSLFIMAGHGALIQYDLDTKLASNVAKEKICDDTPIELDVEAKAQWNLGRKDISVDIQPPLPFDNWLMKERNTVSSNDCGNSSDDENRWLSQVEIITHAGPHRRLWMGPQCVFKTYNTPSGAPLSHIEAEAIEIGVSSGNNRTRCSSPMNMPLSSTTRSSVPVLIESGSYSSIEQSPKLMDRFRHEHLDSDYSLAHGESRLKEDLADAMRESPSIPNKDTGVTSSNKSSQISLTSSKSKSTSTRTTSSINNKNNDYNENLQDYTSKLPSSSCVSTSTAITQPARSVVLIENVVNPLGTVLTIARSSNDDNEFDTNNSSSYVDYVIHENCDESLFRPVVAIFCGDDDKMKNIINKENELSLYDKPPEPIGTELVVPVVEKCEINKKQSKEQNYHKNKLNYSSVTVKDKDKLLDNTTTNVLTKYDELSLINKNNTVTKKQQNKIDKIKISHEIENSSSTTKKTTSTKSERKKSRDETYQQKKDSTISKKDDDEIEIEEIQIIDDKKNQSKKKFKEKKTDDNELSSGQNFDNNSFVKNKNPKKLSLINDDNGKNTSELHKVASDTKLSKIKFSDNEIACDLTQASSEKSLKFKKDKIIKQQQQQHLKEGQNSKQTFSFSKDNELLKNTVKNKSNEIIENKIDSQDDTIQFYEKFTKDSHKEEKPKDYEDILMAQLQEEAVGGCVILPSDSKKKKKSKQQQQQQQQQQGSPTKSNLSQNSQKKLSNKSEKDTETVLINAKNNDNHKENNSKKKGKTISLNFDDQVDGIALKSSSPSSSSPTKIANDNDKKDDFKLKNFSVLSFEPLSTDFSETFLPPLSPLQPFESKFDNIYLNDDTSTENMLSLINFESPSQESEKSKSIKCEESQEDEKNMSNKNSSDEKFSLCSNVYYQYDDKHFDKIQQQSSTVECESEKTFSEIFEYKSLEHLNDNDEQYSSLEPNIYHEHTSASSSEEIEPLACSNVRRHDKKSHRHHQQHRKLADDDEELRPLIGDNSTVCSIVSPISGNDTITSTSDDNIKKLDNNDIALKITKGIIDTLPDNSQSDSSDQANSSEPGEIDSDNKAQEDDISSMGFTTKATMTLNTKTNNKEDDVTLKNKQQQQNQQQQVINSPLNINCCGGVQSSGKKKSKKKRR